MFRPDALLCAAQTDTGRNTARRDKKRKRMRDFSDEDGPTVTEAPAKQAKPDPLVLGAAPGGGVCEKDATGREDALFGEPVAAPAADPSRDSASEEVGEKKGAAKGGRKKREEPADEAGEVVSGGNKVVSFIFGRVPLGGWKVNKAKVTEGLYMLVTVRGDLYAQLEQAYMSPLYVLSPLDSLKACIAKRVGLDVFGTLYVTMDYSSEFLRTKFPTLNKREGFPAKPTPLSKNPTLMVFGSEMRTLLTIAQICHSRVSTCGSWAEVARSPVHARTWGRCVEAVGRDAEEGPATAVTHEICTGWGGDGRKKSLGHMAYDVSFESNVGDLSAEDVALFKASKMLGCLRPWRSEVSAPTFKVASDENDW